MANLLVDNAMPRAAAVKINVAFFEAFGSAGIAALERVRARIPDDVPFIADAKRGDIGTTVARQAVALYDEPATLTRSRLTRTWVARQSHHCSSARIGSCTFSVAPRTPAQARSRILISMAIRCTCT